MNQINKLQTNLVLLLIVLSTVICEVAKEKRINKNINDFNDVDMERLFDQWEENEDPLEPDELPEHLRPQPKIDLNNLNMDNPEAILKLSKKGKTLMTFVNLRDNLDKATVDKLTALWQTSLQNNHLIADRFLLDDNRCIYMFRDGSQAWDAKDFLIEQKEVMEVVIENKPYLGKYNQAKEQKSEL